MPEDKITPHKCLYCKHLGTKGECTVYKREVPIMKYNNCKYWKEFFNKEKDNE